MSRRWIVVLVLVLAAGVAAVMIFAFEPAERTVRLPPRPEARINELLAAERFLTEMGVPARSVAQLGELPPTDHLLILGAEARLTTPPQADALLAWVERGGLLIVGPHRRGPVTNAMTHADPLFEVLGIEVAEFDQTGSPLHEEVELTAPPLPGSDAPETRTVRFYWRTELRISEEQDKLDEGEPADAYQLVWGEQEQGRWIALTDLQFLHNRPIGQLDHAAFFWDLARSGGPRAGALLVYGERVESLLALLWRRGKLALTAAAALLLFAIWRAWPRFGPLLPPRELRRMSLLAHVEAVGRFLWFRRRQSVLLDGARQAVRARVAGARPQLLHASHAELAAALSRGTGYLPGEIEVAMFGRAGFKRDAFTRNMRILESLRRAV